MFIPIYIFLFINKFTYLHIIEAGEFQVYPDEMTHMLIADFPERVALYFPNTLLSCLHREKTNNKK